MVGGHATSGVCGGGVTLGMIVRRWEEMMEVVIGKEDDQRGCPGAGCQRCW
jgi:hypothetical protein